MNQKKPTKRKWKDENNVIHMAPETGKKLRPTSRKEHAALRRFITKRDLCTCQACGIMPIHVEIAYNGKNCIYTPALKPFHIDHIVPKYQDGSNLPSNLQLLCESCNCRKGSQESRANLKKIKRDV